MKRARILSLSLSLVVLLLAPLGAGANNGGLKEHPADERVDELRVSPTPTYYEEVTRRTVWKATAESGLPTRLHVVEGDAFLEYRPRREELRSTEWEVRVRSFARHHETVDAVFDMVLLLPLPADAAGRDAFRALGDGIQLYQDEGSEAAPLVYGGRELVLRRNPTLERTLLPGLIEAGGSGDKLPSLAGTGYRYTVWDAVVAHDPDHGHVVQGAASLRYETQGRFAAPDAEDDRLAAYWITWIPALSPDIAPYAVRLDIRD